MGLGRRRPRGAATGSCPFCYGDIINFAEQITLESPMTAFVVFAPATLASGDDSAIDVGDPLSITIADGYPSHESERHDTRENGLKPFWELEWNPYDARRPPV